MLHASEQVLYAMCHTIFRHDITALYTSDCDEHEKEQGYSIKLILLALVIQTVLPK